MRPGLPRGSVLGLALGGVVLGHAAAYALAHQDAAERGRHLAVTGHGSFQLVGLIGMLAAGIAVTALAIRAARSAHTSGIGGLSLAATQLGVFATMEIAERGVSLGAALSDRAVQIGLVLQVALGFLIAAVTRLFERALVAVVGRRRRRIAVRAVPCPAGRRLGPRTVARGTLRLRAPPLAPFAS